MNDNDHNPTNLMSPRRRCALKAAVTGLLFSLGWTTFPVHAAMRADDKLKRKALIAYFSRTGNTQEFARGIQKRVGGDLFEIRTVHSYPKEYKATTEQAKREQEENFRPQLVSDVPNMGAYEIIFVGYPNWWGTLPMALFSFFEKYDFAGKTLIPFSTHEGSQFGRSVTDMLALCENSTVLEGLVLRGGTKGSVNTKTSQRAIDTWLRKLAMIQA